LLPTQAQRKNEKSGEALRQIEDSSQKGSFHFVDHYDASITRFGEILDDLIPHYYDAARDVTIREGNDEPKQVRINDPKAQDGYLPATEGQHDVTLSVAPAEASQRKAAEDFADSLASNQQVFPQIADLVVKLKQLGPIGDEIADRLTPPQYRQQNGQPPTPADMAHMQQTIQQLQAELQKAQEPIAQEQVRQQGQLAIKREELAFEKWKVEAENAAKIESARISAAKESLDADAAAKEEALSTGIELAHEADQANRDRAHDVAMAVLEHRHASDEAAQARDAAAQDAEAGRAHEAEMARQAAAVQPQAGA